MIKLPEFIQVGPFTYTVHFPHIFVEAPTYLGLTCHKTLQIFIAQRDAVSGDPLPDQIIAQTFWHEVIHCIDYVFNGQRLEEEVVDVFASGLLDVLSNMTKFAMDSHIIIQCSKGQKLPE